MSDIIITTLPVVLRMVESKLCSFQYQLDPIQLHHQAPPHNHSVTVGSDQFCCSIYIFTFESFSRRSYQERLTGEIKVKCLAQGHITRFFTYSSWLGIQTRDLSVTFPTA
jgi:hypothetical protein